MLAPSFRRKSSINTPSQARKPGLGRPFDPRANGSRMLLSVLKTARRVKLSAFAIPFHGQSDVWRPGGEARENVARNEAKKAIVNMIFVLV